MLDVYTEGAVNRTSPEAPVPVVDVVNRHCKAGGAANVVCNIKSLGATPVFCTIVGNDKAGNELIGILAEQGIDTAHIIKSDSRPTTTKERVICDGKHLIRIDEEIKDDLSESEYNTISSHDSAVLFVRIGLQNSFHNSWHGSQYEFWQILPYIHMSMETLMLYLQIYV